MQRKSSLDTIQTIIRLAKDFRQYLYDHVNDNVSERAKSFFKVLTEVSQEELQAIEIETGSTRILQQAQELKEKAINIQRLLPELTYTEQIIREKSTLVLTESGKAVVNYLALKGEASGVSSERC